MINPSRLDPTLGFYGLVRVSTANQLVWSLPWTVRYVPSLAWLVHLVPWSTVIRSTIMLWLTAKVDLLWRRKRHVHGHIVESVLRTFHGCHPCPLMPTNSSLVARFSSGAPAMNPLIQSKCVYAAHGSLQTCIEFWVWQTANRFLGDWKGYPEKCGRVYVSHLKIPVSRNLFTA